MNDVNIILTALLACSLVFLCLMALATIEFWMPKLFKKFLMLLPLQPAKNTVTGDTPEQRAREWICRFEGCITVARYYAGMPQATCRRCGHRNRCAQSGVKEWREPDL